MTKLLQKPLSQKKLRLSLQSVLLISLFICLLLLSGCGNQAKEPPEAAPSVDTITVTDCRERTVEVPLQVNRIACLCPEAGYALALFGQGEKMVAGVSGIKRDLILTELYPSIKDLPVPKGNSVINIEELANCQPDVVFVKADTANNEAEVDKLNKSKLPFLVVEFNNIAEQRYAMQMIGQVAGVADIAQRYNQFYQTCIDRVQERMAAIPQEKRVRVYHSINEATRTDIRGSLSDDWLRVAGADNVSAGEDLKLLEGKYFAGLEQILLWDPAVILVNEPGVADYILTNKQWSPLQAVKNQRVYQLPNGVSRWGHTSSPETPLVILWTAKTLYPDLFADLDLVGETIYFYQEFFGLQLTDTEADQILYGGGMRADRGREPGRR